MQKQWIHNLIGSNNQHTTPSESLKQIQTAIEISAKDLRLYMEYLDRLDVLTASGLNFQKVQEEKARLVYDLNQLIDRTIQNQEIISRSILDQIYQQVVELEQVIGEPTTQIDSRFMFYNFDLSNEILLQVAEEYEVETFADLIDLVRMPKWHYAYFHLSLGNLHLLICQYVSSENPLQQLSIPVSSFIDPPSGVFDSLQRRWGKQPPVKREILHLFTPSDQPAQYQKMGLPLETETWQIESYSPHAANQVDQLPKIIYDFINVYGIQGRQVVHLLRQRNRSVIFLFTDLLQPTESLFKFPTELTTLPKAKTKTPQIFLAWAHSDSDN